MKILLIKPNDHVLAEENGTGYYSGNYKHLPYSLAVCASILRENFFDIRILDAGAEGLSFEAYMQRVEAEKPDIIVIAANAKTVDIDFKGIARIKNRLNCKVICLLGFPVFLEEVMQRYPCIDIGIGYEWGWALLDSVKALSGEFSLERVKGITYRQNNGIVKSEPREHTHIDNLPMPAFGLLPMDKYDSYTITTSVGCSHRCSFCAFGLYPCSGWEGRSIENVLKEINLMMRYGRKNIGIIDNEFTQDVKRAKEFCKKVISSKMNISWGGNTRASIVDEELLALMAKAGYQYAGIGVESGVQSLLNLNRKDLNLEDVKRTVRLLQRYGIRVKTYFLIGLVGDTRETLAETFRVITRELTAEESSFDIAIPYPGTYLFNYLKRRDWIEDLTIDNLIWIHKNVYKWENLQELDGEKPFWRVGDLTFDDLCEIKKKYYPLVKKNKARRLYLYKLKNETNFIPKAIGKIITHPIASMRQIERTLL